MKKTLVMTIVLALLLSVATIVSAATATSTTVATPANVKAGETVTVKITFTEAMATGVFGLKYNENVLTYKSVTSGMVTVDGTDGDKTLGWINADAVTELTVTFEAKADGESTVAFVPTAGTFGPDERTLVEVTGSTSEKVVVGEKTTPVDPGKDPVDVDKTALETAKAEAAKVEEAKYTAESYKALTDALAMKEDTQEEVNAKVAAINSAIKALVVKPADTNKPGDDANKPSDTNKPGNTDNEEKKEEKPTKYDQTGLNVVTVAMSVVAVITLAGVVIAKKAN